MNIRRKQHRALVISFVLSLPIVKTRQASRDSASFHLHCNIHNMRLTSAVKRARNDYLRFYRLAVESKRREAPNLATELLIRLNGVDPTSIESLWRVDMAVRAGNEPQLFEVNLDALSDPGNASMRLSTGVLVTAKPLVWNGVEFHTDLPGGVDESSVRPWFERWIDLADAKPRDRFGFASVIHSVTRRGQESCGHHLAVDFGTAPVIALMELFQLLASLGATDITIDSCCYGG